MMELIRESKGRQVGKRTKGLYKSLNGRLLTKEIHAVVMDNNKWGKFCKKSTDPGSLTGIEIILYQDFKDMLRWRIDKDLVMRGKKPIWNEKEDMLSR